MSNTNDVVMQPTHVFASLAPRVISSNENLPDGQKRKVEVSGSAEITVAPDTCILSIVVTSCKEKAAEARTSVERRVEYIKQTLLNNSLPEEDIVITENLQRIDKAESNKNSYCMETQIDVTFYNSLQRCMKLSSLFVEKLENSVKVLPPVLKHNQQQLESHRKRACLLAFTNARQKATELCRMLNQRLGKAINVTENVVREQTGSNSAQENDDDDVDIEDVSSHGGAIDVQRRAVLQTINIRVDVTASFELKTANRCAK